MRAALPLIVAALVALGAWYQSAVLEQRIAALEARGSNAATDDADGPTPTERLATAESTLKSLAESFFTQATDVAELKQERDRLRKARLDLEDKTFSRVETPLGPLFVQAEAIRRKPEETAIDLLIGNPSAATMVNASLRVRWGRAFEPNSDFQLWQDGLKEKEFTVKDPLRTGSWNRYTVHLETGPVTQVGFLELSIDAKTVLLHEVAETSTPAPRPTTTRPPRPRPPRPGPGNESSVEPLLDGSRVDPAPAAKPTPNLPAAEPEATAPRVKKAAASDPAPLPQTP